MFIEYQHPKYELEYREYKLSPDFPILPLFSGNFPHQDIDSSIISFFHFHNCIEIGVCHRGEKCLIVENKEYKLNSGDFFIIPPYSVHFAYNTSKQNMNDDNCEYLFLEPQIILKNFFHSGLPQEMNWFKTSNMPQIFTKDEDSYLYDLLLSIFEELNHRSEGYKYAVQGLLLSFMVEITRKVDLDINKESSRYKTTSSLLPAINHINNYYYKNITVNKLANLCCMSITHFRSLFTKSMQQTPVKYINKVRLQKACELLCSTEDTILDIAINVGFQSSSNFYHHFRDFHEISPTKWRNNRRAIQKKNYSYSPFLK